MADPLPSDPPLVPLDEMRAPTPEPVARPTSEPIAPLTVPPRRHRRRRRLLIALGVLVALVTAAPFALGIPFVRRWVAGKASDSLHRRVTIGGISAAWWSGIELRDVEIHNPPGYVGAPLLAVDRVHVDVALFQAIGGSIDADVDVEKPVVTLIRGPDGGSNLDGLFDEREKKDKKRAHVVARVRDGRVTAHGGPGAAGSKPDVVDAISATVEVGRSDQPRVSFQGIARGAGAGGRDAALALDLDGAGALRGDVPRLDLARLRALIGAALDVDAITGTLEIRSDVALGDAPRGVATVTLEGVECRRGTRLLAVESGTIECRPAPADGATRFDVAVALRGLRATGWSRRDGGLVEPTLAVRGAITRSRDGELAFGSEQAPFVVEGRTISGTASGSLRRATSGTSEAGAALKLSVTLSPTLGRLAGLLASEDDDLRGDASIAATLAGTSGPLSIDVAANVKSLVVGGAGGATPWSEPSVTLSAQGTWDGAARSLVLARCELAAGAISARASPGFTLRAGESTSLAGEAKVDADLARLAGLSALVPMLRNVTGGRVSASVTASEGPGLTADWRVEGSNVAFTPGTLSSRGFLERKFAASGRVARNDGDVVLTVAELSSSVASLAKGAPVALHIGDGGFSIDGKATLTVDLFAAGVAFDRALGVGARERMSGRIDVGVTGRAEAGSKRFEVTLAGRDVAFPGAASSGPLDARATIVMDERARTTTISDASIRGAGLDAKGSVLLSSNDGPPLRSGELDLSADLAAARALVVAVLGFAPDEAISGTLRAKLSAAPERGGARVTGTASIDRFHYVGKRDPTTGRSTVLDEAQVTITPRLVIGSEPGLLRIEESKIAATTLSATVRGAVSSRASERAYDLSLAIDGDLARIAEHLRTALGPSYDDAAGEGRLTGTVSLVGSFAGGGRDLRLSGDLAFARIGAGGITASDGRIRLSRAAPGTALTATVTSTVNGGTLRVDGSCNLGEGDSPWSAKVALRGVDTSPMLTGKGAGRALTLVLPAIVPKDATSNVLSGLLDADLDVRASSISAPLRTASLSGPGNVRMTQGEVRESTLFGALGGGKAKALDVLVKLVPAVGKALDGLSRAVAFQELSSVFQIGNERIHLDPVVMVSPSVTLRFKGVVGFDGTGELDIPLVLGGGVGKAIEPYVKDRTIPLHVTLRSNQRPTVVPRLRLEDALKDKGKDLLEDALKGKFPKIPKLPK